MKKVRIGIFGLGRGSYYIDHFLANGADVVAICDKNETKLRDVKKRFGDNVAAYNSFDEFIEHPMDAVLLANYFHEHADFAIRCLEKDIHVLSECTSNSTMAEGVRLVRAAEKSNATYTLAENYPYMDFNVELKRICDGGTLGKIMFAEGEYNHPGNPYNTARTDLYDSLKHWRAHLPRTYYITHSLAPIVYATGSTPVKCSAMPIFNPKPADCNHATWVGDGAAVITCLNDDGSVFRVTGHASFGAHENSYRVCGSNGQAENIRFSGGMFSLAYNEWNTPEGAKTHNVYKPVIEEEHKELVEKAGHGGGDFRLAREFLECIREGKQHPFDVYFATNLASVAILSHRSILNGGIAYDIPDFRKEEDRIKYENDNETPFWGSDGSAPNIPCCSKPDYEPSDVQIENFKKRIYG